MIVDTSICNKQYTNLIFLDLWTNYIRQTIKHIETNNILAVEQLGFRTSSSTEKASYKLIDDIWNALNDRLMLGGIFCDIQKAFNCVNHDILLAKLEFYGIRGITYKLLKSYLKGRY
jgi:hypothetical protein